MKTKIKEGNYAKLGVCQEQEWTNFTFCGEKEDQCYVVLTNTITGTVHRIEVPQAYYVGSLRSIAVADLSLEDEEYYFEINGQKVMDPCAHAIMGRYIWNDKTRKEHDYEVCGAFVTDTFDWGNETAPEIPEGEMVMYKLHVRGFTMDADGRRFPGTFLALKNKITYLKKLGVTTIELMPVYEFEEMMIPPVSKLPDYIQWNPKEEDQILPSDEPQADPKVNYWGYVEGNYFAVKASYASKPKDASAEYKALIKKLHDNYMECIMEMFFPEDIDHNLVLEALHYWVREYHVDGFHLLGGNLPMTAIVQDNMLSRTKIFYTGFDANICTIQRKYKNLYVYKEEYMYPARRVLNHFNANMREFIDQQRKQGNKYGFVNFITSNNGFTLADLFMYNDRHNEANGEDNLDGNGWNFSNNYGVEGPTKKRYINKLRKLKWRNSMAMLFLAQGVPLVWSGDEISNSQQGNNNAYCQDNPVGWVNWKNEKTHRKEIRFLEQLAQFRREHPIVANEMPFQFSDYRSYGSPDLSFHGESAWILEPSEGRMALGMMYNGAYSTDERYKEDVYVAYNFYSAASTLALPKLDKDKHWYLVMDTSDDEMPFLEKAVLQDRGNIVLKAQSICVLVGRSEQKEGKRKVKEGK